MGKYFGISRHKVQPLLKAKYNLSEKDWDRLQQLWSKYGMRGESEPENRTPSNHYFLQGIIEHLAIEWSNWSPKMSQSLKEIIKSEFPQLMVNDREFEID